MYTTMNKGYWHLEHHVVFFGTNSLKHTASRPRIRYIQSHRLVTLGSHHVIIQESTIFSKIYDPPQNARRQKGDIKQVPTLNIRK
jgi:hypothetical protein